MLQRQLTIKEGKIRPANVLTPFMRLYNPGPVLAIRGTRRAGYIIHLFHIFLRHTDRVLRMPSDDHIQITRWQFTRHFHVTRRI